MEEHRNAGLRWAAVKRWKRQSKLQSVQLLPSKSTGMNDFCESSELSAEVCVCADWMTLHWVAAQPTTCGVSCILQAGRGLIAPTFIFLNTWWWNWLSAVNTAANLRVNRTLSVRVSSAEEISVLFERSDTWCRCNLLQIATFFSNNLDFFTSSGYSPRGSTAALNPVQAESMLANKKKATAYIQAVKKVSVCSMLFPTLFPFPLNRLYLGWLRGSVFQLLLVFIMPLNSYFMFFLLVGSLQVLNII